MAEIRALPVFAVAAHDLAVMPRGVGTDQLVPDAQPVGGLFKQRLQITFAVGKPIG